MCSFEEPNKTALHFSHLFTHQNSIQQTNHRSHSYAYGGGLRGWASEKDRSKRSWATGWQTSRLALCENEWRCFGNNGKNMKLHHDFKCGPLNTATHIEAKRFERPIPLVGFESSIGERREKECGGIKLIMVMLHNFDICVFTKLPPLRLCVCTISELVHIFDQTHLYN